MFYSTIGVNSWQQLIEYFKLASKEILNIPNTKKMINVWADRYANYPDLISIHCMQAAKYNILPQKCVKLLYVN
jgi:hypothetical protein